ncbi:36654_t:CDS:2, partial [Racocetra persica]
YLSKEDRLKLKHPDYWDRDPSAWSKINDWDIYWIGKQPPSSSVTKQKSHSALADELRSLKDIYADTHPAYNVIKNLQKEMKGSVSVLYGNSTSESCYGFSVYKTWVAPRVHGHRNTGLVLELSLWSERPLGEESVNNTENIKIWKERISTLWFESKLIDLVSKEKEIQCGLQLNSDVEFDLIERERKRLRIDEPQSQSNNEPQSQSNNESKMLPKDSDLTSALKILSTGSFINLRQEGGFYLDKTYFISKIESLNVHAVLSLRPRRFGKSLFLSTLSSYYDIKNKGKMFEKLFGDLYIGKNPTSLATSFLVLQLNFSGLRTNSMFEVFEEDFHRRLNIDIAKKCWANFKELLNAVELSGHKLYILIDEYDAVMNEVLKNESVLKPLAVYNQNSLKIERVESSFKQFYSLLKSACDNSITYIFQTGVTPIVMAEVTSGFNISTDLALREEFWDLYGFKKSEVEALLDTISENRFSHEITNEIMKCVTMLFGRIKHIEDCKDSSINIQKLLRFSSDPHTLPSQMTLDLIVNNPLGKSILTEAIGQFFLESKNGIEQRFRLVNIQELTTDRTPLLSFLFYTGALTYQPENSHFSFQISNN